MKITKRRVKLAWRYRALLWRYRNVIRYRREIGTAVLAGSLIAAGLILKRKAGNTPPVQSSLGAA